MGWRFLIKAIYSIGMFSLFLEVWYPTICAFSK
jgi:hypothetical protein